LRPPDFAVGHPLSRDNGVRPETIVKHEPIGATALKEIMERYQAAQRRGRVQLAIDGSGSMGTSDGPAGQSRFEVARQGALRALDQMGEADEFGLSIFPTFDTVPVGPLDGQVGGMPRHQATRELLGRVKPGGGTPLFRALVEGVKEVTAVGPSDEAWASALVVLTDGEDTTSGLTAAQVVDDVRGKGVRVFVIAIGELTCSTVALTEVTTATGGRCVNATPDSIEKELTELFGLLWGVG
jgi:von Willebrand factor type A domain